MSTEYMCHDGGMGDTLEVREHSGVLDVVVCDYPPTTLANLTPEQVATMALKMLKAAYYQDEEAVQLAARASRGEYQLGLMI